jgi:hypothetical protein
LAVPIGVAKSPHQCTVLYRSLMLLTAIAVKTCRLDEKWAREGVARG